MNEMVSIPKMEYLALLAAAEHMSDIAAYDRAIAALASGDEERIPAAFANRLINGESPLLVFRQLRGLTQSTLATRAGIGRVLVAEIETGRKQGSVTTLRKLAEALDISVDDLV